MSTITDRRTDLLGVHRPNVTPTEVEAVDTAGAAWTAEWSEYRTVDAEWRELTQGTRARSQAERADAAAFAAARLAGKPDPGAKHTRELAARVDDLSRRRMGLAAACAELESRYLTALEQHAAAVAAERDRRLTSAREVAGHVVDLLGEALEALGAAHEHAAWVQAGPSRPLGKLRVAVDVKGENVQLGHLIAALREHARRRAASEKPDALFVEDAAVTKLRPIGPQKPAPAPDVA